MQGQDQLRMLVRKSYQQENLRVRIKSSSQNSTPFSVSHHDQKIDAVINGWNVMNEVDCWGNDIVQSHDFQTVEQCIAYWNWLTSFYFP